MKLVIIKASLWKMMLYATGCLGLSVLGILLIGSPEKFNLTKSHTLILVWGILTLLFSIICTAAMLYMIFMKKNGLILNQEGITDHSSIAGVGLIRWEDIQSVKEISIQSRNFLHIVVRHPEKYLRTAGNRITRRILKHNTATFGTPVIISANLLECSFGQLKEAVNGAYAAHKKRQNRP